SLVRQRTDLTLVPPSALRLTLGDGRSAVGGGSTAAHVRAAVQSPTAHRSPPNRPKRSEAPPSWWTARARAGEVTPGFTKAEITRAAKDDPRAPDGVFERVGDLLSELVERM